MKAGTSFLYCLLMLFTTTCSNSSKPNSPEQDSLGIGFDSLASKIKVIEKKEIILIKGQTIEEDSLLIPQKYKNSEVSLSKKELLESEQEVKKKREIRLNDPRRIHIVFDRKINSFNVDVMLHPEHNDDSWGMAKYHFKNKEYDFYLETAFSWNWGFDVSSYDKVKYKGETYHVDNLSRNVIQKSQRRIDQTEPFLFKDVDFDGNSEICFLTEGYNRVYYSIYKILGRNKAVLMSNAPYNNIVEAVEAKSDENITATIFDYSKKTITVNEQLGAPEHNQQVYELNKSKIDPLNPMQLKSGVRKLSCPGFYTEEITEYNSLASAIVYYPTKLNNWAICVNYHRSSKSINIQRIEYVSLKDDSKRFTLYSRK